MLYSRMRWNLNRSNIRADKVACQETQKYERRLERERKRKNLQRIQSNPKNEISTAIRKQNDTRKRKVA